MVRDCPTHDTIGIDSKQDPFNVQLLVNKTRISFMIFKLTRKQIRMKVPFCYNFPFCVVMCSFLVEDNGNL